MEDEILEELKRIRKLLEPKPPPPPPRGLLDGFKAFVSKYNVLGMAVAFVLGLYSGALIKAAVDDLIMPVVQLAVPDVQWESLQIGPFRVGHFAGALLTFVMVTFVIFILVRIAKRLGLE